MNTLHRIFTTLVLALFLSVNVMAEGVSISVRSKDNILPPQVMYYIANPGAYFTVQVTNTGSESEAIYFGCELRQLTPSTNQEIIITAPVADGRPLLPKQGIAVAAGQTRVLDNVTMLTMFNHVRQTDVQIKGSLFGNALNNSFGLLEEGMYEFILNAYKWDPTLTSPVLLSNPVTSRCTFQVCYQASAPKWVSPTSMGDYEDMSIATLSMQTPLLSWLAPNNSCGTFKQYFYDLKIVQAGVGESYDRAMDNSRVVYQINGLTTTSCLIPALVIKQFSETETYVAQITARTNSQQEGTIGYVEIQNQGKSNLLPLRVKDYTKIVVPETPKPEEPEDDNEISAIGWGSSGQPDSLYRFKNPEITTPLFSPLNGARKLFTNTNITVGWDEPWYLGGKGSQPDTLKFAYKIEVYAAKEYLKREEMLAKEPIFTLPKGDLAKDSLNWLTATSDTIQWEDIQAKVSDGDYLLMRVVPACINSSSVYYADEECNIVDFAMTSAFSKRYFECSNDVEITNTTLTDKKAKSLPGELQIGEYTLFLDDENGVADIENKPGHFKGTGHVMWEPLSGYKWMLAVKFDDIAVNTDGQVISGTVETFEGKGQTKPAGFETVEKLYSDWGLDNLIGDSGIPYANQIQGKINGKLQSLGDELGSSEFGKYADYLSRCKNLVTKAELSNVTFPLKLSDAYNAMPLDVTISKMKFTATSATMDLFATYKVPDSKVTEGQVLMFGAPRICISPKSLIPDGTTIALLKDFQIKDPDTDYDCTFKAPKNVIEPEDGCFVSWSNSRFELAHLSIDMTLPDIKKVDANNKMTEDNAKLHIETEVSPPVKEQNGQDATKLSGWDWYAYATLDPFQHVDLPGYTFSVGEKVLVDHTKEKIPGIKPSFPSGYDKSNTEWEKDDDKWMGVYIKSLSMKFPESVTLSNDDNAEPLQVGLFNTLIDATGFSSSIGAANILDYHGKEGSITGFGFALDSLMVNIVQNNFDKFYFTGQLMVPLFTGKVDFRCDIYNQEVEMRRGREGITGSGYAYVFKTSQVKDLNMDFWLGDLKVNKDLTYFLLEAVPDADGKLKTQAELLIGGEVSIADALSSNDKIKEYTGKLPIDLTLPELHFTGLRVSNVKASDFKVAYATEFREKHQKAIEERKKKDKEGKKLLKFNFTDGSEIELGSLWFDYGQWGLASKEKKIGPFTFALKKYDLDFTDKVLSFTLGGGITFCDELSIGGDIELKFKANVNIPKNPLKFSEYSLSYGGTDISKVGVHVSTTGLKLDGTFNVSTASDKKGFDGNVDMSIGSKFIECKVAGGYYSYQPEAGDRYSYGFLNVTAGGKLGIPMGPITMKKLGGAFYFNCVYKPNDELHPTPSKGAIGILFDVGLATADQVTFDGDFNLAVAVMKSKNSNSYRLSTFKLDGKVTALEGVINAKTVILYQNDDQDRYFQLNASVEAGATGLLPDELKEYMSEGLEAFNKSVEQKKAMAEKEWGEAVTVVKDAALSFTGAMGDKGDHKKTGKDPVEAYKEETKTDTEDDDGGPKLGHGSASLDIRIQSKKGGQELNNVLWHVYLGQPDEDKRCKFILVDFESPVVSVSVGADAYLCIGSELPNNGQLPPLPKTVQKFLDGDTHGTVKSDNMSAANSARSRTLNEVLANAKINGGVMIGAHAWGRIGLDLGLLYGSIGAEAGFDLSIVKLSANAQCVNLNGGRPGYKGWYGSGQLYAYMYASLGFRVYLGFWNGDIPLASAGLGGVLEAKLPNPNYFRGKLRANVKLLGGLIHINKTFQFTCGNYCQLCLGNALDDYELFGDISMGYATAAEACEKKVSPNLSVKPQITTTASIDKSTRVIDPTEEERIKQSSSGNGAAEFSLLASRTFRFHLDDDAQPYLQVFNDSLSAERGYNVSVDSAAYASAYQKAYQEASQRSDLTEAQRRQEAYANAKRRLGPGSAEDPQKHYITNWSISGEQIILNLSKLPAGKIVRITVTGRAQEFRGGRWEDPETWNTTKGRYEATPWTQSKSYYIATYGAPGSGDDEEELKADAMSGNSVDLQDYTRVAYPMPQKSIDDGVTYIRDEGQSVNARETDVRNPMISLSEDISGTYFNEGDLQWRLYSGAHPFTSNTHTFKYSKEEEVTLGTKRTGTKTITVTNDSTETMDWNYARIDNYDGVCYAEKDGKLLESIPNRWVANDSVCILMPEKAFTAQMTKGDDYTLRLLYTWTEIEKADSWTEAETPKQVYGRVNADNTKADLEKKYHVNDDTGDSTHLASSQYRVTVREATTRVRSGSVDDVKAIMSSSPAAVTPSNDDDTDDSKQLYIVTVEKKGIVDEPHTYSRIVASIPLKLCDTKDATVTYDSIFYGTRLDKMLYTTGFHRQIDENYLGGSACSGFAMAGSVPAITIDPMAYMSYMSNLCFVAGYRFKSDRLKLDVTTTASLAIQSPFDAHTYELGQLMNKQATQQIWDGYLANRRNFFLSGTILANEQTVYPLRAVEDSRIGQGQGVRAWAPCNSVDVLTMYRNLTQVCADLSTDLAKKLYDAEVQGWNDKADNRSWKNWLSTHKDKSATFTSGTDEATSYTLNVPYYQYAIVRELAVNLEKGALQINPGTTGVIDESIASLEWNAMHTKKEWVVKDEAMHWRFKDKSYAQRIYLGANYNGGGDKTYQIYKDAMGKKVTALATDADSVAVINGVECLFIQDEDNACHAYFLSDKDANGNNTTLRANFANGNKYKAPFDCEQALKNVSRMDFTDYRVNAWNFKEQRWTVFAGSQASTSNQAYYRRYYISNPFTSAVVRNISTGIIDNDGTSGSSTPGTSEGGGSGSGGSGGGEIDGTTTNKQSSTTYTGTISISGSSIKESTNLSKETVRTMTFADTRLKDSKELEFSINSSNLTDVIKITVDQKGAKAFSVDKSWLKKSGTVTVTFNPQSPGSYTGVIAVQCENAETQTINVSGVCKQPRIIVSLPTVSGMVSTEKSDTLVKPLLFPEMERDMTSELNIRVDGEWIAYNSNIKLKLTNDGDGVFELDPKEKYDRVDGKLKLDHKNGTVSNKSVLVTFKPNAGGKKSVGVITLTTDRDTAYLKLEGKCISPTPELKLYVNGVQTDTVDFGKCRVGGSASNIIKIVGTDLVAKKYRIKAIPDGSDYVRSEVTWEYGDGYTFDKNISITFKPSKSYSAKTDGSEDVRTYRLELQRISATRGQTERYVTDTIITLRGAVMTPQFKVNGADNTTLEFHANEGKTEQQKLTVTGSNIVMDGNIQWSFVYDGPKNENPFTFSSTGKIDHTDGVVNTTRTVTFKPKKRNKLYTGTITLRTASGVLQPDSIVRTIRLEGYGEPYNGIQVSRDTLDFPVLKVGSGAQSAKMTIDVTRNNFSTPVTVKVAEGSDVFSVDKTAINTNQSTLTVTFKPNNRGRYAGTIELTANGVEPTIVALNGVMAEPKISLSYLDGNEKLQPVNDDMNFGQTVVGENKEIRIFVNAQDLYFGDGKVHLKLSNNNGHPEYLGEFSINVTELNNRQARGLSNQPDVSGSVLITFKPTMANSQLLVDLSATAEGAEAQNILFRAAGVEKASGKITANISAIDFGSMPAGTSKTSDMIVVKRSNTSLGKTTATVTGEGFTVNSHSDYYDSKTNKRYVSSGTGDDYWDVTFKSTSTGTYEGTLTISCEGADDLVIPLKGVVAKQNVTVSPTSLTFKTELNGQQDQTFTYEGMNIPTGQALSVKVTGEGFQIADAAGYFNGNTSAPSYAANSNNTVAKASRKVRFIAPYTSATSGKENYEGMITITTPDGSVSKAIKLTATVVMKSIKVTLKTSTNDMTGYTFGSKRLKPSDDSDCASVKLHVSGDGLTWPVTISKGGINAEDLRLGTTKLSKEGDVTVYFSPQTPGARSAEIYLTATGAYKRTIKFTGTGITPSLTVSKTSMSFNATLLNPATSTFSVSGSNLAYDKYGYLQLSITGADAGMFNINKTVISQSNGTVPSTVVTVTYKPTAPGTHTAQVVISTPGATRTVTVTGTAPKPVITVSSSSFDFGRLRYGSTSSVKIHVDRINDLPGNILVSLEKGSNSKFTVGTSSIEKSTDLTIKFNATGSPFGSINDRVVLSNSNADTKYINLSGYILTPKIKLSSGTGTLSGGGYDYSRGCYVYTMNFGSVKKGKSLTLNFNLSGSNIAYNGNIKALCIPNDGFDLNGKDTRKYDHSNGTVSSQKVNVKFKPNKKGNCSSRIIITTPAGDRHEIDLIGSGS